MSTTADTHGPPETYILRAADGREDIPLVGELRVGRQEDCEIHIQDKRISRYHARISVTGRGLLLQDMNSTNGSFVNGERVVSEQLVKPGDELRFYDQVFRLLSNRPVDVEATVFSPALTAGLVEAMRDPRPDPVAQQSHGPAAHGVEVRPERVERVAAGGSESESRRSVHKLSAIQRQGQKRHLEHDHFLERVRQLSVGDWLDLERDNGEHMFFCKLDTPVEDPLSLYFVSRSGFGRLEVSADSIASEIEHGRCHLMDKGPLLGRLLLRLSGGPGKAPRDR